MKNVSEKLQSPKYRHWQQVKQIVRYLAGTRDFVGTKHFTKERFEALRKMVDMEAIRDRNSVRYIGTIKCDKNEALELAEADFRLMGIST